MPGGQRSHKTDAAYSSVPKCNLMRSSSANRDAKTAFTSVCHPSLSCPVPSLSYSTFLSHSQQTLYPGEISLTLAQNGVCLNRDCSTGLISEINYISDTNSKRFGSARPSLHDEAPDLHPLPTQAAHPPSVGAALGGQSVNPKPAEPRFQPPHDDVCYP